MSFFVTADGGLTTAGYVGCVVLMVALVALAFVTSYVKVFELPYGGSVTLFSMLFIVLIANWYGAKTGILVGFLLMDCCEQFIQGRMCCRCSRCAVIMCLRLRRWVCRILWKEEKRAADRVYCSCAGEGIFPYVRRVSVLDGLYAGEFPRSL